ncbi:MAG: hypothetical protein IKZ86_11590 [Spirochaetaceae bacterium]|nr:hypothetical protein [Spirochaetaceae bacterium]
MKYDDVEFLKQKLKVLLDAKCTRIGRSCNLVWFYFHIDDKIFNINVQSALRFTKNGTILCANLDMYEPKKMYLNDPSFDYKTFNWDVQGENYFDEWGRTEGRQLKDAIVKQISVSDFGDLHITFDNDIKLEIYNNNSLSESWRFFERTSDDDHTVVLGNVLEE